MTRSTSLRATRLPGETGIWVLIGGDLLVFALFFGTFTWYQAQERELFTQSRTTLNQGIGILNTVLMVTSSWFVARAVHNVRGGRHAAAAALLVPGLLCGAGFLVNKGLEWGQMIGDGHTLLTNNFFMYFYMLTGIHALHVLIGMGVLAYMYLRIRGGARHAERDVAVMESGAAFWHLVDLLWIVLFSLLYLLR